MNVRGIFILYIDTWWENFEFLTRVFLNEEKCIYVGSEIKDTECGFDSWPADTCKLQCIHYPHGSCLLILKGNANLFSLNSS